MVTLQQLLRALAERITASRKADERDRGVDRVMNDIEVLRREAEWWQQRSARQLGQR